MRGAAAGFVVGAAASAAGSFAGLSVPGGLEGSTGLSATLATVATVALPPFFTAMTPVPLATVVGTSASGAGAAGWAAGRAAGRAAARAAGRAATRGVG